MHVAEGRVLADAHGGENRRRFHRLDHFADHFLDHDLFDGCGRLLFGLGGERQGRKGKQEEEKREAKAEALSTHHRL